MQFGSWAFTERARASGLLPSTGSIGDCVDNAMMESYWSRVQVELLDRRRWRTRLELSTALFEYLDIFHNRQRRHSALEMLTPVEYSLRPVPVVAQRPAHTVTGVFRSVGRPSCDDLTRGQLAEAEKVQLADLQKLLTGNDTWTVTESSTRQRIWPTYI